MLTGFCWQYMTVSLTTVQKHLASTVVLGLLHNLLILGNARVYNSWYNNQDAKCLRKNPVAFTLFHQLRLNQTMMVLHFSLTKINSLTLFIVTGYIVLRNSAISDFYCISNFKKSPPCSLFSNQQHDYH